MNTMQRQAKQMASLIHHSRFKHDAPMALSIDIGDAYDISNSLWIAAEKATAEGRHNTAAKLRALRDRVRAQREAFEVLHGSDTEVTA